MADTASLDRIKLLRREAASFRGVTERWQDNYGDRKVYDKQGFGFKLGEGSSLSAFALPLSFEAYTGVYGSSSVSRAWSVDSQLVKTYLPKALNAHKQAIFETMAKMMEAEAAELVVKAESELQALQNMLSEAREPVEEAQAA